MYTSILAFQHIIHDFVSNLTWWIWLHYTHELPTYKKIWESQCFHSVKWMCCFQTLWRPGFSCNSCSNIVIWFFKHVTPPHLHICQIAWRSLQWINRIWRAKMLAVKQATMFSYNYNQFCIMIMTDNNNFTKKCVWWWWWWCWWGGGYLIFIKFKRI